MIENFYINIMKNEVKNGISSLVIQMISTLFSMIPGNEALVEDMNNEQDFVKMLRVLKENGLYDTHSSDEKFDNISPIQFMVKFFKEFTPTPRFHKDMNQFLLYHKK